MGGIRGQRRCLAERAGVTKKTLYYYVRSKDELVAAYLSAHDQPTLALYQWWFAETNGSAADKVRGLFTRFGRAESSTKWKGCGFLRTTTELASTPGHPAVKADDAHKRRFEAWLGAALAEEGIADANSVARRTVVLLDGAAMVMLVQRDVAYVEVAGDVPARLVK
jgi:AcrR family transcriptional regulator